MFIENPNTQEAIQACFNQPCKVVMTSGVGDGIIIKFRMFILKIYENRHEYSYTIYYYGYGMEHPYRTDICKRENLLEYLKSMNI